MHNFYVPVNQIFENQLLIMGEAKHHLLHVLRLKPGDKICVFDGQGEEYLAQIKPLPSLSPPPPLAGGIQGGWRGNRGEDDSVVAEILSRHKHPPPKIKVTLYQGLPKGEKLDLILQKTTELGVDCVVPMRCHRSVPRFNASTAAKRHKRWQRILIEASQQCGRAYFPKVTELTEFQECVASLDADLSLMLWEEEQQVSMKTILRSATIPNKIALFVGTEGGFTEEEVQVATAAGAISVSLGSNILRTETAAIVAVALVLYEFEGS